MTSQPSRAEWLALAQGAAAFRDTLLIPLMLAENGVRKTDRAKRLNRYLTAEQIVAIEAIPPVGSDPENLVKAHAAIAQEYLTRARRLVAQLGAPWPEEFERASPWTYGDGNSASTWVRSLGVPGHRLLESALLPGLTQPGNGTHPLRGIREGVARI